MSKDLKANSGPWTAKIGACTSARTASYLLCCSAVRGGRAFGFESGIGEAKMVLHGPEAGICSFSDSFSPSLVDSVVAGVLPCVSRRGVDGAETKDSASGEVRPAVLGSSCAEEVLTPRSARYSVNGVENCRRTRFLRF